MMPARTGYATDDDAAPPDVSGLDPLSDLFLTVVAALVLALVAILPELTARASETPVATFRDLSPQPDGSPVLTFLAARTGLTTKEAGSLDIPLAEISASRPLASLLDRATGTSAAVVLVVAPGGSESAFLFEAMAAARHVTAFARLRLDRTCRLPNGTTIASCRAADR